jgi:hypothetical protein
MINFKKVVSMVVMLSLMLGACGKSPVRRDGGDSAGDGTCSVSGNCKKKLDLPSPATGPAGKGGTAPAKTVKETWSEWWSRVLRGAGVGAVAMGVAATVGTAMTMVILGELLSPLRKSGGLSVETIARIAGNSLIVGVKMALPGAVYGVVTAGDGLIGAGGAGFIAGIGLTSWQMYKWLHKKSIGALVPT